MMGPPFPSHPELTYAALNGGILNSASGFSTNAR
ncbi:hypothetical protein AGR4B_Lc70014 [Agrobacterium tumefaciens str. CFBP 5621]|nr:hypothetical protein AGR4B_Lc70014 [Agrobacterium tumefaciens str. CFBP 5621]